MYRWFFIIFILYGLLFVLQNDFVSNVIVHDSNFGSCACRISNTRKKLATIEDWNGCPKGDGSLESTYISAIMDESGLGNQVWAYLSVWAMARRFGIRPVMPEYTLNRMSQVFDRRYFRVPSLPEIGARCDLLPWILDEHHFGPTYVDRPKDIFRELQTPMKQNLSMIKFGVYVTDASGTIPLWNELAQDLVIREELRREADQRLRDLRRDFFFSVQNDPEYKNLTLESIQFVSAHIRRSDYVNHVKIVYPNASAVEPEFYKNAFAWLKKQINAPLMFIVITDDMIWAQENVGKNTKDVFTPGTGTYHDPGLDMALLAACNYSIFAYGTFGLTGALLANGDYTILYDTGNNSVTKEMQFASGLPGWYIMDKKGELQYEQQILEPTFWATS